MAAIRRVSALQREIRQHRPFASPAQEASLGILRTADVVRHGIARLLAPHALSLPQYNVLRIVRGAGVEGIPTLEIAARVIERAPGITRLLDGLERKRLVRRERCPRDRRQVLCYLTPAGGNLLAKLDAPMLAGHTPLEALSGKDLATLIRLLDAIRAAAPEESATNATDRPSGRPSKGAIR